MLHAPLLILAACPILLQGLRQSPEGCLRDEFQCADGTCLDSRKFCDRFVSCPDGSGDRDFCTPCNRTYFGEVGRTYELEIKKPSESQIPFLCFLNFTAGGAPNMGELIQLTFESFSVGSFEPFSSSGCPDGFMSIEEANRLSSGGKWCGSDWGYTVYYSEANSINLTLSLQKLTQQVGPAQNFDFKLTYKFLRFSDARIRYGNSTLRSYRGKLTPGTYCDRVLENCAQRPCRIQSPNYPGIYPRNISCEFKVRERSIPKDKHALIIVKQANYHFKDGSLNNNKFEVGGEGLRWNQCNLMPDYLEIFDGWGQGAPLLAHLCSGETIPEVISSGPELTVKFHTAPFGNPLHPLPHSFFPGIELEIAIIFVDKQSPTYFEQGKQCEFVVRGFESTSGLLESPLHSLPANTTCYYHFRGQARDVIWISFIKYHVTNDFNAGDCDVRLQIWDGDYRVPDKVQLLGQFCRDDKPKLCDHSLLKNSSRQTRPCGLAESYLSTKPDLTISQSIKLGSVLYPVHFVLRYEFVDMSQEGQQMSRNPCDRLFQNPKGRFFSPKIPFLFGRGGQENLTCFYHFVLPEQTKLRVVFNKIHFAREACSSDYNPETNRWVCRATSSSSSGGFAALELTEHPWPNIEIKRACFCSNITKPFTFTSKTTQKVTIKFVITDMTITDDHHNFFFDANYEMLKHSEQNCVNPWNSRRLRGSSGEIVRKQKAPLNQANQTLKYCWQHPWLIEPERESNFIYLKVLGSEIDPRLCTTKNRILVYPAGRTEDVHVICPMAGEFNRSSVEMFSEGWSLYIYRKMENKYARSFIVEFIQREPGNFVVNWMEVSKNPAVFIPTSSVLVAKPPECPHSCPELGACISSELWCDGLRHCPSGSDEQEANCSVNSTFPMAYLNSVALAAAIIIFLILITASSVYLYKHWRRQEKNVIVSVTEHTFLEFKSGLC